MPLTPEDVSNKRFTPVRLREGYDMAEVDQFLDEVESELARLTQENDNLRGQLSSDGTAPAPVAVQEVPQKEAAGPESAPAASEPVASEPAAPEPAPTPAPAKVTTVADASSAAARLLELATRNADELVTEARAEADRIVDEARTESERLHTETTGRSEQLENDARTRSQSLDAETAERRQQLLGDLERDKQQLNAEVENLRAFEREYRSRLKTYFEQQLSALDGNGEGGVGPDGTVTGPGEPGPDQQPSRLSALLAEDAADAPQDHRG